MTKFLYTYNGNYLRAPTGETFSVPDPSIIFSPMSWQYDPSGTGKTYNISLSSSNQWKVVGQPSWVTFASNYNSFNGSLTFDTSAAFNTTDGPKSGTIVCTDNFLGGTFTINVSQGFINPSMIASPTFKEYVADTPPGGRSQTFAVTSNVPWDVSTNPAWVTIDTCINQYGNGSFRGLASVNSGAARQGKIVMKCVTVPNMIPAGFTIDVSQLAAAGDSISLDCTSIEFSALAAKTLGFNPTVTSSGAWTSAITYYDGSGWITINPTSGSNGQLITTTVSKNLGADRAAYIRYTCGTAYVDCAIYQYGVA
jgi:hypothetical protein